MVPKVLLDTHIRIHIARNRPPSVAGRFAQAAPGSLGISLITWGEVIPASKHPAGIQHNDQITRS